ncbi:hypothetical protein [Streptomyces sp. NPDC008001]|uniref:hypothetical protein n=1 Tax=Streptomyces sp. NPDC008001 TaxID=3364804 RepID=UPI0036E0B97A
MISSRRRTAAMLAALAVTVTLTGAATASAYTDHQEARTSAVASATASVTGSATFELPFYKDKDVRSFTFDAHGAPYTRPLPGASAGLPADAKGTIKVSHYSADRNVTYTSEAKVDCLVTSPHTATVTAIVTEVSPGMPADMVGKRIGLSVYDGGKGEPDRVGFSWDGVNLTDKGEDSPVGTCMAPAPYAPVVKGGYTVKHAELQSPPQKK